jgi:hypothetical protein
MSSTKEIYIVSEKTQVVVDDYKSYVAGGFAPYPVRNPSTGVRVMLIAEKGCSHSSQGRNGLGCGREGVY